MKTFNKIFVIFLIATTLGISCQTSIQDPVDPNPPIVVVIPSNACEIACQNLRNFGCAEGQPINTHKHCHVDNDCSNGQTCSPMQECMASCEQFCADAQNTGMSLDVSCAITINSCDKINSCQSLTTGN